MEKSVLEKLSEEIRETSIINNELYLKYEVKRGLRDISGKGVLAGLTEIAEARGTEMVDGKLVSIEGQLVYRGIDINDLIEGFVSEDRFGFEETIYLLLFGKLPNTEQLDLLKEILVEYRELPEGFIREIIMKTPGKDVMNTLARGVLALYAFDDNPDDTSLENVLRQSLFLISNFPLIAVYSYSALLYNYRNKSLIIHKPKKELSLAENILHMLRPDNKYTKLEAQLLDLVLVLHAEHGGGNNSTFTNHVVSSSGTDTYAAAAASICSLKGYRHGGANLRVTTMMDDIKKNVSDWGDENEVGAYLDRIMKKEVFDGAGLIYGVGHAVYSLSDPRAVIMKTYAERLAHDKGFGDEFNLYSMVEKLAPEVIGKKRKMYKGVSVNVDFYSGFVYRLLNLPPELFTPLFAASRIVGWSAHRMEEIANEGKIIRPAYKSVSVEQNYIPLKDRS